MLEITYIDFTLCTTIYITFTSYCFPGGTVVKNLPASAVDTKDAGSIPGSRRSSRVVNSNSHQYSCLQNSMDRGTWWATVHGVRVAHN